MGRVNNDPLSGHIFVENDGGHLSWSSQFPPVNLLPESSWLQIPGVEIAFPDFNKFINYGHRRWFQPPSGNEWVSDSGDVCQTITMIEPEERALPDIVLGSVPSGTNFIDVRVLLSRSKAPYPFLNDPVPPLIAEGLWSPLPGGSCLVEATAIWRRLFDVVLYGQSVVLRRRQSVAPVTQTTDIYDNRGYSGLSSESRDPWGQSSYSRWGWTFGGADWQSGTRAGHPAALIQTKEYGHNSGSSTPSYGAKHIRRSNHCSLDNSAHDFSSIYTGQIVVRPGYIKS